MLRFSRIVLIVCASLICCDSSLLQAQAPEVTVVARSVGELKSVIRSLGDKAEMFGLTGPVAFLDQYSQHIDAPQPIFAAMTISTPLPKFVVELGLVDVDAFYSALASAGFKLNSETGELSRPNSGLRFFVEQNDKRLRVADSADFLHKTRLPQGLDTQAATNSPSVIVTVDWRNLSLESRANVCRRGMSVLTQDAIRPGLSIGSLPALISDLSVGRIAALMNRAENFTLRFSTNHDDRIEMTTEVKNRSLGGSRTYDSAFASINSEDSLLSGQWNLPVENELRTMVNLWSQGFADSLKVVFANDEVQDAGAFKVLQQSAQTVAQHCKETIALERLQGSVLIREHQGQAVAAVGLRVANAAKLDGDLRKLLTAAVGTGAPISQLEFNIATSGDLSLHRFQLDLGNDPAAAADSTSNVVTCVVGTSSHALLIGFGAASERLVEELIAPTAPRSTSWMQLHSISNSKLRSNKALQQTLTRLGFTSTPSISIDATAQGFTLTTLLPEVDVQPSGQLTGTRAPVQP